MSSQLVAVTVIGRDRPGIIAEATAAVAELGGNIQDSAMTLLRGHFSWMLIAEVAEPDLLRAKLAPLTADGLVVSVLSLAADVAHQSPREPYILTVHGADRPGIVAAVTATIAKHGGNITDLSTRLGDGGLYVLIAEVLLPADLDVAALGGQLDRDATDLGVGVSLRAADSDLF
ncbi:MAG: glycine cleavage system protein R [Candidatus Nanopelagicales bacterium]